MESSFLDEAGSHMPSRIKTEDARPCREIATLEIVETHLPEASESDPETVAWRPYAGNAGALRLFGTPPDRGNITNMCSLE